MSLLAAEKSAHRALIVGLVLIGPVDWRATLRQGRDGSDFPHRSAASRPPTSAHPSRGRWGCGGRFGELDWTRAARVALPILVIHSEGDLDVPIELSRQCASLDAGRTLVEFAPVPHCAEYNAQPDRFNSTIRAWFLRLDD